MMKPLYKITQEYLKAYHDLYDDDELPEDAINNTLEGIQGEIQEKALNIASLIKNMKADASAIKDAEESMNNRRKRLERRIESLSDYLLMNLKAANIDMPIESAEHYIAIKECPFSVVIDVGAVIPLEFLRIIPEKREPDKNMLKDAINKGGVVINGVALVKNIKLLIK